MDTYGAASSSTGAALLTIAISIKILKLNKQVLNILTITKLWTN